MDRIIELVKEEIERSEEDLRSELSNSQAIEYRHEIIGGLGIVERIKGFVDSLGKKGVQMEAEERVPNDVLMFIAEAKSGKKFVNNHGLSEKIDNDVYKVMYYIIKEDVSTVKVKDWVNNNRDLFAKEWLK